MNKTQLIRRCDIYNETYGTDYTLETYDYDRTRVPSLVAWDQGWESCDSEACRILAEIVAQYDAAPDGQLGRGFTNGPFLAARNFLRKSTVAQNATVETNQ